MKWRNDDENGRNDEKRWWKEKAYYMAYFKQKIKMLFFLHTFDVKKTSIHGTHPCLNVPLKTPFWGLFYGCLSSENLMRFSWKNDVFFVIFYLRILPRLALPCLSSRTRMTFRIHANTLGQPNAPWCLNALTPY